MKLRLKNLKNILLAFATITAFAACNGKKADTRDIQLMSDSSAYTNDMYSDTSNMEVATEPVTASPRPHSVAPIKSTSSSTTTTTNTTPVNNGTQTTTTQTTTRKKAGARRLKAL